MTPEFVAARLSDSPALLEMMRDFYELEHIEFDLHRSRAALEKLIANPAYGRVWLIYSANLTAGYAVLTLGYSLEFGGRDAFIDELYLQPEWRGKGLGRATIDFLIDRSRSLGVRQLQLEVDRHNDGADKIYRRAGFEDRTRLLLTQKL